MFEKTFATHSTEQNNFSIIFIKLKRELLFVHDLSIAAAAEAARLTLTTAEKSRTNQNQNSEEHFWKRVWWICTLPHSLTHSDECKNETVKSETQFRSRVEKWLKLLLFKLYIRMLLYDDLIKNS